MTRRSTRKFEYPKWYKPTGYDRLYKLEEFKIIEQIELRLNLLDFFLGPAGMLEYMKNPEKMTKEVERPADYHCWNSEYFGESGVFLNDLQNSVILPVRNELECLIHPQRRHDEDPNLDIESLDQENIPVELWHHFDPPPDKRLESTFAVKPLTKKDARDITNEFEEISDPGSLIGFFDPYDSPESGMVHLRINLNANNNVILKDLERLLPKWKEQQGVPAQLGIVGKDLMKNVQKCRIVEFIDLFLWSVINDNCIPKYKDLVNAITLETSEPDYPPSERTFRKTISLLEDRENVEQWKICATNK